MTRYGLLETIRQFTDDQRGTTGGFVELRDRHARHYANQLVAQWELWDGPRQRDASEYVEIELDNLRAGFRWATDQADLVTAITIAGHTTLIAHMLQQFEPIGWAEELLPAAVAADLPELPQLSTAAAMATHFANQRT